MNAEGPEGLREGKSMGTERSGESAAEMNLGVRQPNGFPGLPGGWESRWETYLARDQKDVQIFCVTHSRREGGHRSLIVIHGLGEHGGRYLHFPHFLADAVDHVVCPDHRGHGRSGGGRGHADSFDEFVDDVVLTIRRQEEKLKRENDGRAEIHLFGHSMGGLVALRLLQQYPKLPVASATICAPLLGTRVRVPKSKMVAGRVLARVWGSLQLANEIDIRDISHDEAVQETYRKDRLVHGKITPKLYVSMEKIWDDTISRPGDFRVPLQFLIPLEDQIVDPEKSKAFADAVTFEDKRTRLYAGSRHEAFNENAPEFRKEQAFEDLKSWITAHPTAAGSRT